jgi:hypothetical protein
MVNPAVDIGAIHTRIDAERGLGVVANGDCFFAVDSWAINLQAINAWLNPRKILADLKETDSFGSGRRRGWLHRRA